MIKAATKVFKFFKKIFKASSRKKGPAPVAKYKWPSGIRIGVYGHTNSGKSVYFTTLHEDSKVSKNLQISVTDSATASEFLVNYRHIWGLGSTSAVGTIVDMRGDQKFPDPTEGERLLQFNAILDRDEKLSVVTYDYEGKAVSIREGGELKEKVIDFMDGAHGIMFFYDPKLLGAELESQAHVASFITMLERLAPLSSQMPIPVALVITKADVLPGFTGESQTVLVRPEDEQFFSEEFEVFLDKVLSSNKIASNSEWAGSVRTILVKMKEFLKIIVRRTLNFQVFFLSCTGQSPEKVGTDVGRSIYKPPRILRPVGLQEPFYWMLKSVMRNRAITRVRKFTRFVVTVSILWIVLYSIPNLYHFQFLLPQTTKVEDNILEGHSGQYLSVTDKERPLIISKFDRYSRALTVKWLFPKFSPVARTISETYRNFNIRDAIEKLDGAINRFAAVVADSSQWPTANPKDTIPKLNENHIALEGDLAEFHTGDSSSVLFKRSDRSLWYWSLFKIYINAKADTLPLSQITEQIESDKTYFEGELSKGEVALMGALQALKVTKVRVVESRQAGSKLEDLVDVINGNNEPGYRLDDAVRTLQDLQGQLGSSDAAKVSRYLSAAKNWSKKRQTFNYKVVTVPDQGALYIEVTDDGKAPQWEKLGETFQGDTGELEWKIGDDIHIVFCAADKNCDRGKDPSDIALLDDKYSLFDMEKGVVFDNLGKSVKIQFNPSLGDRLPVLE
ncbi:MAG: hypothetical protein KKH67_08815 [candidate division Zixibacteria bacterium]|nr:hypothetical protein [candidate division Zixibacteria bacterium]MBU1471960.1 hypothetical protein [candidate division Zixibacteria bacterium]